MLSHLENDAANPYISFAFLTWSCDFWSGASLADHCYLVFGDQSAGETLFAQAGLSDMASGLQRGQSQLFLLWIIAIIAEYEPVLGHSISIAAVV